MAWAGILGALGNVAGGLLGAQGGGGQGQRATYNPSLDYAMQVAQYAALDPLGFGMLSNIPDPYQQLIGRLQNASMDNKTRRRALTALENIRQDPSLLNDPYGTQFTRDQIFNANKTGDVPFGRVVTRGKEGGGIWGNSKNSQYWDGVNAPLGGQDSPFVPGNTPVSKWVAKNVFGMSEDTEPTGLPIQNIGRLQNALRSAGISLEDLQNTFKRQAEFKAQIERLRAAGLDKLSENTILNRAQASASAASLLGDAGRFATGAAPTEFQSGLLDRINRNINEQEQQYLLRAQFGGFNPGVGMRDFQNMRQDSDITALTQAVQAASALMGGLQGGTQGAQQAAQQSSNASLGALGIAANQAMAANQLGQNASINRADSLANGVSGGLNQISQSILLSQIFGKQSGAPAATRSVGGTGTESGFRFYEQPWG